MILNDSLKARQVRDVVAVAIGGRGCVISPVRAIR